MFSAWLLLLAPAWSLCLASASTLEVPQQAALGPRGRNTQQNVSNLFGSRGSENNRRRRLVPQMDKPEGKDPAASQLDDASSSAGGGNSGGGRNGGGSTNLGGNQGLRSGGGVLSNHSSHSSRSFGLGIPLLLGALVIAAMVVAAIRRRRRARQEKAPIDPYRPRANLATVYAAQIEHPTILRHQKSWQVNEEQKSAPTIAQVVLCEMVCELKENQIQC